LGVQAVVAFVDVAPTHPHVVVRLIDGDASVLASLVLPSPDNLLTAGAVGAPALLASPRLACAP
jgi:hypothetical protein